LPSSRTNSLWRRGVSSGNLVVAGMVLVAAILAGVTVWHHWSKGHVSIAYWGAANGENIRYAPIVTLTADGETFDISKARGLVHFRQALIEDASFSDTASRNDRRTSWTHEVVFSWPEKGDSTKVQFDLSQGLIGLPKQPNVLVAKPEPTLSGLVTFFDDVMKRAPR